jgi:hypothetical protein
MANEKVVDGQKVKISVAEFNKKVEIEASMLIYFEYMKEEKAFAQATEFISKTYEV